MRNLKEPPIPRNHSEILARRFFAIAHELGYEAMFIKAKAKKKFNKNHFNELDDSELDYLISRLTQIQNEKDT